jgi:cytochrome bd-type quinol oxidase subunit 1
LKGNKTLVGKVVNIYGSFQLQARSKKTNSSAHMVPDNNYMKMKNEVKIGKMAPEQFQEKLDSFDKETRETVNTLKEKKVGSLKSSDSFASPPPAKNTIAWFMLSFGWISFFALIGCLFSVQSLKSWILEKVPGPKLKDILIGGTYLFFIITYALALGHSLGKLY